MSEAITRFEKMGVDVDMLVRRREGEHGIVAKQKQLDEIIDPSQESYVARPDETDETFALREDIAERQKLARQQTAHTMHGVNYERHYLADHDDTEAEFQGEQAFGWIFANQVLAGIDVETAAANAEKALLEIAENESTPLFIASNERALVVPAVSLGSIALRADLKTGFPLSDSIGIWDLSDEGYVKERRTSPKWSKISGDIKEEGLELKEYPATIFTCEKLEGNDLGTKVLTNPEDIGHHLLMNGAFVGAPELGTRLVRESIIELDDTTKKILEDETKDEFYKAVPVLAQRAIERATRVWGQSDFGDDPVFGDLQLLFEEMRDGEYLTFPTPANTLGEDIGRQLYKRRIVPPYQGKLMADHVSSRSGRKAVDSHISGVVAKLNFSTGGDHASMRKQGPNFTRAILKNVHEQAANAYTRGEINTIAFFRINRFCKKELGKLPEPWV